MPRYNLKTSCMLNDFFPCVQDSNKAIDKSLAEEWTLREKGEVGNGRNHSSSQRVVCIQKDQLSQLLEAGRPSPILRTGMLEHHLHCHEACFLQDKHWKYSRSWLCWMRYLLVWGSE